MEPYNLKPPPIYLLYISIYRFLSPKFLPKIHWQVQKGCAGSWHGFIHGHAEAVNVGHFGRIPTNHGRTAADGVDQNIR